MEKTIKPFLKSVGCKTKIVNKLKENFLPANRFIEPFFGSGVVSLNTDYPNYIANDINADLISVWTSLKEKGEEFIIECEKLFIPENNNKKVFNDLKQEFNTTKNLLRKAMLFLYLNHHSYKGLCRYNKSGLYNVSFGTMYNPSFPKEKLQTHLEKIKKFEIYNKDFREIFKLIKFNDFIFCDPPYLPLSNPSKSIQFFTGKFLLKDHIDLIDCAIQATYKGATTLISNHANYKHLYDKASDIIEIQVGRSIKVEISKRTFVGEILAIFKARST